MEHMLLLCNKQLPPRIVQSATKKRHVSELPHGVQYYVECCQTDLCNGGPFPILHDFNGGRYYIILCFYLYLFIYFVQ